MQSLAAHRLAPYASARLAMVYVDNPQRAGDQLGLRVVDGGANVLLAAGEYDVVFDRTATLLVKIAEIAEVKIAESGSSEPSERRVWLIDP